MQNNPNWFAIVKDIIIPGLTLIATISIGTFIAFILKNREEKEKRKSILIDTYIDYLNIRAEELDTNINNTYKKILNDILINSKQFIGDDAKWDNKDKLIVETLQSEEKQKTYINNNWSFYTYKFCFLLGTKKYKSHLQNLETRIIENLYDNTKNDDFYRNLVNEAFNTSEIKEGLLSSNQNVVKLTIDKIKGIVAEKLNNRQRLYFQPYDSKVADLIDKL